MNPHAEDDWKLVAEAHGGDLRPDGKVRMVDLGKRPRIPRNGEGWRRYSDALVNLLLLAGRGGARLRTHTGYSGKGRYLTRDA